MAKLSLSSLVTKLREIRNFLERIFTLVQRPITQKMRCTIYEDINGNYIAMRFSDQYYDYDETLYSRRLTEFIYEIGSGGISIVGYSAYDKPGMHAIALQRWSHLHEEHSNMRVIDLPRGKYGPHIKIIQQHFSQLPGWAWGVYEG